MPLADVPVLRARQPRRLAHQERIDPADLLPQGAQPLERTATSSSARRPMTVAPNFVSPAFSMRGSRLSNNPARTSDPPAADACSPSACPAAAPARTESAADPRTV